MAEYSFICWFLYFSAQFHTYNGDSYWRNHSLHLLLCTFRSCIILRCHNYTSRRNSVISNQQTSHFISSRHIISCFIIRCHIVAADIKWFMQPEQTYIFYQHWSDHKQAIPDSSDISRHWRLFKQLIHGWPIQHSCSKTFLAE